MLEVLRLTKLYRGLPGVEEVSFTLGEGEILGYVGPNGSGKSTTVKMLTGLLDPTAGQILFHGRDVREDPVGFKRCVGYVPIDFLFKGHAAASSDRRRAARGSAANHSG